jgi:RNase H-like domain found in reverse transcriptase
MISQVGIKFNSKGLSGLVDMERPRTAAGLQKVQVARTGCRLLFQITLNWQIHFYKCRGVRMKLARPKLNGVLMVYPSCGGSDSDKQQKLRSAIVERVTLSRPDKLKALSLHTDASQDYYAAVLTQKPQEALDKNADEQRHEPLAFISGRFVKAIYNWSVLEKYAVATVAAMTRLRYLTIMRTVDVHTNH